MRTRRLGIMLAVIAMAVAAMAPAALAKPPIEKFQESKAWMCPEDGFVDNHCINAKSLGKANTFNIKVFAPDLRGPQESASTNPKADLRPCPHDSGADPDGTWWEYTPDFGGVPLYVCHHSGQQSK